MKKISKYSLSAMIALSIFVHNALAATTSADGEAAICKLLDGFKGVIGTLRTLAFIGAAFMIMDWAWGFIKAGDVTKDNLKDKGVALLVGFALLLGVGFILNFVMSASGKQALGCVTKAFQ